MYTIKIEFLRGPFQDDSVDKSASITVDGLVIGEEVDSSRQNFECKNLLILIFSKFSSFTGGCTLKFLFIMKYHET